MKHIALSFSLLFLLGALLGLPALALAQDGSVAQVTPEATAEATPTRPPNHVVEDGETLTSIAALYDVTVADLLLVNGMQESDLIFPGQTLLIPGGEGASVPAGYVVQAGDTLAALAQRFNTTVEAIATANRLVSSDSLYAGQTLAIVSETGSPEPRPLTGTLHLAQPGETMLMLAARYALSPEAIAAANNLDLPVQLFEGMRLRIPVPGEYQDLPGGWERVRVRPVPLVQGQTASIYVEHAGEGVPTGTFGDQQLQFAPYDAGYVALAGVDALNEPGRLELALAGEGSSDWWPFAEEVAIISGDYPTQTINVAAELEPLLAPEVRAEEDAFLHDIYTRFTPEAQWDGLFQIPVSTTIVTAGYGGLRSYNGGPFEIFHTGVDFAGTTGTPILAAAAGTVVFRDTLELRGQTLIIDHGLGVFSAYNHLSAINVQVGDRVEPGQPVALGGSTGLSTGPHLHWELRVMDVPVDGMQWTRDLFP
ncbi:MAG: LysM peptidoglycan-binding domain-containing protein [Chloroflexi bacterium]|nr:LysM peptidoglycan-binding domain-containing protein [Chloroflexota bacterium]